MDWLPPLIMRLSAKVTALGSKVTQRQRNRLIPAQQHDSRTQDAIRGAVFDRLSDGVFIVDQEGALVDANQAAIAILGAPVESVRGKRLDGLLPLAPDAAWPQTYNAASCELQLLVGGQVRWYEIALSPYSAGGVPGGCVITFKDSTERRNRALKEKAAREAAEEAIRLKSEFLAVISHEIRTPMHAVIGVTNMLLGAGLTDEQRSFVDTIRAAGDSMLSIVNNVLDFSKIEAGQIELERLPFSLETCIESTLDIFAGDAAQKGIELSYLLDDTAPSHIMGDMTRFRQVLTNLVGNAVKFTDRGEVSVQVAGAIQDEQPMLHVQVCDTGIGIPVERLDRLFHSFSQADASTTRRYGGSGLGLVISKRLCELMGGSIWVESQPGDGTTFHFTIAAPPAPFDGETPLPHLAGRSALVVDDQASTRAMLRRMLSDLNMNVATADSGWSALEQIETAGGFDVILVDLHMPGMDGESLVRRITAERANPRPRLVMLLALTDGAIRGRAAELGLAACITKPVKRTQLRNALSDLFSLTKPASSTASGMEHITPLAEPLKLKVLLADDNLVGRRVTQAVLRRLGCEADIVGNGHDVLAALEMHRYDAVLMDIYMPGMDGLATTRRIRKDMSQDQQPWIIALTASAITQEQERCLEAGMNDFLAKPVRINALNEALRRIPAAHAKPPEPEEPPAPIAAARAGSPNDAAQ